MCYLLEHAAHAALVKSNMQSSNPSATSVVRRVKLLWINCHWLDQSLKKQSKRCVKRVAVTIERLGSQVDRNLQTT